MMIDDLIGSVGMVIFFCCLIIILICKKNRSSFDLCMKILNKIVYWYLVVLLLCVFIAFMFSLDSLLCFIAIVLMSILKCICRILIKITDFFTYLLILK